MKSLLCSLLIISAGTVHAASTDTAKNEGIPFIVPARYEVEGSGGTPVEQKVVEIHMASKVVPTAEESKHRKNRKIETLPFSHGTCSGALIDSMGDIVTARHCVDGFDSFEVLTYDQRHYIGVVIATSTAHDLALIHIDRRNTAYFDFAENATRGERIFVLGSPLGITDTLSAGVIARFAGDITLLDCSALPGNSGGPVFNQAGELVGILNAGYIVMLGVTHLNMAQGLDAVYFFVAETLRHRYER